ncbi:MAG: hypothetical protein RMJ84_06565 [Sandaracinaceae bacterium]|nr:hypothetical protein [Sandaracinaceae bacterium]
MGMPVPASWSTFATALMGFGCVLSLGGCLIDRGPLPFPVDQNPRVDTGVDAPQANDSPLLVDVIDVGGLDAAPNVRDGDAVDAVPPDASPPVVVGIDLGLGSSCAWLSDGSGKCWGWNMHGQLGDATRNDRTTPVRVMGLSNITAISVGGGSANEHIHTCALLTFDTSDEVRCWGDNEYGQLGNDTMVDSLSPVRVIGLSGIWSISAGGRHTCALLRGSGEVRCWGDNEYGQLGNGMMGGSRSSPVTVYHAGSTSPLNNVSAITTGEAHTCALLSSGEVRCWGRNNHGQLGNRTTTNSSDPVATVRLEEGREQNLTSVRTIAAGWNHTCAVVGSDAQVFCWGDNSHGQLGSGMSGGNSTTAVSTGLRGAQAIAAGGMHTCALLMGSGEVLCWGANWNGQLGDGTMTNRSTPVPVRGLSGVTAIALGSYHSCAITQNPTTRRPEVLCWGRNNVGELGDGTTMDRTTPVMVMGP